MEVGAWSKGNQHGHWNQIQKWYKIKKWGSKRLIHFNAKE